MPSWARTAHMGKNCLNGQKLPVWAKTAHMGFGQHFGHWATLWSLTVCEKWDALQLYIFNVFLTVALGHPFHRVDNV